MTGTILKYPGSKNRIADKIISLFPEGYRDMTYLEPFFGSGTVFFRKARSAVETINDLNEDVYNFFLQIRDNAVELARLAEHTPWSRLEYDRSRVKTESAVENARRFLVRCWMSIGSTGGKSSWSNNVAANNGNIQAFVKVPDLIKEASARLRSITGSIVQIENRDAFELIEKYDRASTLMYLDPPYVLSTRHRKYYTREMTDEGHAALCRLISKSKAKIILSGYANDIYETRLKGFRKETVTAYDETGSKRTEVLWMNYVTTKELFNWGPP